ncbi:MAG: DinB family protein [Phycisphaerales bacterium]|nr:MAG: DinB family protein [Phycisphaerales bacterium]
MANESRDLSSTDPEAYVAKMRGLVGKRDRIGILSETAEVLAGIVREHSVEQMRARPFEGKWTPNEILGHLCDAEWVFGYRMRAVLCEDEPQILAMDHERWVSGQGHNEREPAELVEAFRHLREANLSLWRRMTPADLRRRGLHNERGAESLDKILLMKAGHDLSHIDQIRRYLAAGAKD